MAGVPTIRAVSDLQVAVKLFASVREAVGREEVTVRLSPGAAVRDLLERLAAEYPEIARHGRSLAVAVNHEIAPGSRVLLPGDEVALIPPVGGG